jgi:hypothetical protein
MHNVGTQITQALHEHGVGVLGYEHPDWPLNGTGERARSKRGVAA